jgi:GTP-binding protein
MTTQTAQPIASSFRTREDIRNVAIIAHVDHGKTTLVDFMLRQSGAFRTNQDPGERIMDSMDLEREKGITILAKNTSVRWRVGHDGLSWRGEGPSREVKINIVDTPGHADFGGEVERGLTMVDGALLLVDASEGPLPQTRFVLRKALARDLPIVLVINKTDRPDARIKEVVDEVYGLFIDLDATDRQIDFPIVYTVGREGRATLDPAVPGLDLRPLFDTVLKHIPPPQYQPGHGLQALVTNLDASTFVGRIALCRVINGTIRKGQNASWCRRDGSLQPVKITELYVTEALDRVPVQEASAGEIIAVAGIPEITIGETLADEFDPAPLPVINVDEPSLAVTVGINTSPLAGLDGGTKLTARLVKGRLDQEVLGNVSIRVLPSDRPDTWVVQGRGELQLAVLVETMRREGFEITVGKPEVVTRVMEGRLHEPMELLSVDVPEAYMGLVAQSLGIRKGRMTQMVNHGSGRVRMEFIVPARGLIGFHNAFMIDTRGTGLVSHNFDHYAPWQGDIHTRPLRSMVADRRGVATAYALLNLQERGTLFIAPGDPTYEGMVIGETGRPNDMDVNPAKEKKQTNVRSETAETTVKLAAHRKLSLEEALEFINEDECLEVTPKAVRIRKVILSAHQRERRRGDKPSREDDD